ncbi:MAG: DsbA family protein [Candidatus Manganitrophaceae bacterium]|nr:MAG: DsbA family protein [Candidatus Manganitrophaceae bacterium]
MEDKAPIKRKKSNALVWAVLIGAAAGLFVTDRLRPPREAPPETPAAMTSPPPIPVHFPVRGEPTASVTIEEFSDFQCPYCARSVSTVKQILEAYPGRVRWVFRHFPVFESHPDAPALHLVSIAAGEQGRFWEMHDLLFENREQVTRDDILGYARRLNLDMKRFQEALGNRELIGRIETDYNEAVDRGVRATPTFFINGRKVEGAIPYSLFKQEVERALADR